MKKLLAATICAGMVVTMTACGGIAENVKTVQDTQKAETTSDTQNVSEETQETSETTQIPNPFVTCSTMQEASEIAGFDFAAPESVDGYAYKEIAAIENDMAQITYFNSDELDGLTEEQWNELDWSTVDFSAHNLMIRKAAGDEDVSGDYNEYPEIYNVTVDEREVTMKGTDGSVNVAIWNEAGYSYAITASDAVTADYMLNLIQNTK